MSRLSDLEDLRLGLVDRMESCSSDQNYAVLGRLLVDVVRQIEELAGPSEAPRETGLSDFERRLREREAGASGSRRTSAT